MVTQQLVAVGTSTAVARAVVAAVADSASSSATTAEDSHSDTPCMLEGVPTAAPVTDRVSTMLKTALSLFYQVIVTCANSAWCACS
jgi:hypothetical protein